MNHRSWLVVSAHSNDSLDFWLANFNPPLLKTFLWVSFPLIDVLQIMKTPVTRNLRTKLQIISVYHIVKSNRGQPRISILELMLMDPVDSKSVQGSHQSKVGFLWLFFSSLHGQPLNIIILIIIIIIMIYTCSAVTCHNIPIILLQITLSSVNFINLLITSIAVDLSMFEC